MPASGRTADAPARAALEVWRRAPLGLLATLMLLAVAPGPWRANAGPQKVAVFDFELINTSLEPERPEERARLELIGDILREELDRSGRYQVVAIDRVRQNILSGPELRNCNGCDVAYARQLGAAVSITGTVQKVSNLILNINLFVKNVSSGALENVMSVDIRGNTDESWTRGIRYLIRHRLLAP